MTIRLSQLLFQGYLYLMLPLMIFFLGWIKLVFSIPLFIGLCFITYMLYKDADKNYSKTKYLPLWIPLLIALIMILLTLIVGVVGVFPQSGDMTGRNTMFADLIEFSWPVIYPINGAVVYYNGHWLVPALVGKLFGYTVGQIALLIWTSYGLTLLILLTSWHLDFFEDKKWIFWATLLFMIFGSFPFKGDTIFIEYMSSLWQIWYLHNQSVGTWLMVIIFIINISPKNFVFLGLSSILYSPYAIIGIIPFMIYKAFYELKTQKTISNIFSPNNILSTIFILPILYMYFTSNATTSDGFRFILGEHKLIGLLITYFCSFGFYAIIIMGYYKKDPMYWISILLLVVFGWIKYSNDHNFSRAFHPALFILFIYIIRFIKDTFYKYKFRNIILFIALGLGSYSGISVIYGNINYFVKYGVYNMKFWDYKDTDYNRQWSNKEYKNTKFFKYLSK